ncbi:hypothetical protein GCM10010964_18700 [Caldovatus sediminis]|uniref:Uncharacterized protein n=1 Tax=Caldovatus sediminis TaxID=2041189 RepID=A0A8J2ZBB8_9PROT|nr:hypothetical protein [Caldovatus sediminis]GGG31017.1 hypothetical protein GCM10010964_18700 [Caldovatus sediminis]
MADIPPAAEAVIELGEDGHPLAAPAAETAPAAAPDVVELGEDGEDGQGLPRQAARRADGSIALALRHPVVLRWRTAGTEAVREERIERLVLHRLTGADLRAVTAASEANRAVVAIARSARIPEGKFGAIFDRMDAADLDAAARVLEHFFGPGRKTGR